MTAYDQKTGIHRTNADKQVNSILLRLLFYDSLRIWCGNIHYLSLQLGRTKLLLFFIYIYFFKRNS